jgi:hypothetical protein
VCWFGVLLLISLLALLSLSALWTLTLHFRHDWERTGRFAIWGTAIMGPILHHWYKGLERIFPGQTLGQTVRPLLHVRHVLTSVMVVQEDRVGADDLCCGHHSPLHGNHGSDVRAALE